MIPQETPSNLLEKSSNPELELTKLDDSSLTTVEADYEIVSDDCNDLTELEQLELETCEKDIESGIKSFYQVGKALLNIRDKQLYRETHTTFADYCLERWDIPRSTAYQFIDAAVVIENVRNCGHFLPANEAQARPLVKLKTAQQQQQAWQKVVETAPGGKVTAKHVDTVVNDFKPIKPKKPFGKEYRDDSENGTSSKSSDHGGTNIENSTLGAEHKLNQKTFGLEVQPEGEQVFSEMRRNVPFVIDSDKEPNECLSLPLTMNNSDMCQEIINNVERLTDEQVTSVWQSLAYRIHISSVTLILRNWSDPELNQIIKEAQEELNRRHHQESWRNGVIKLA